MKTKLTFIWVLSLIYSISYCQDYKIGDKLNIISLTGLNFRSSASAAGSIIKTLNYGDQVIVIAIPSSPSEKIDGFEGKWIEVLSNKDNGYIFDSYASKIPVFSFLDHCKNCVNYECYRNYADKFGVIDSCIYYNCIDGESFHAMRIFNLMGGNQFIFHTGWEGHAIEMQFLNLREAEGIMLSYNILFNIGVIDSKALEVLKSSEQIKYFSFRTTEETCDFYLIKCSDRIIIKIACGV
jgi:hypothetical protein